MLKEYLENEVIFTDIELKSKYIDCFCPIMATNESELMKESADVLCSNSGSVLNVGFGLGIIDTYIRNHNPKEHHIIEAHPQVCEKAKEMGFDVHCGLWEDVVEDFIKEGKTFDSIYFDTYVFDYEKYPQWASFTKIVPKLLNPNGIYSYFNDIASKIEKVEEIIKPFGWEKHQKTLPHPVGHQTYELIWYINK